MKDDIIARQKKFEGFKSKPYKCSIGVWTIGHGATLWYGQKVTKNTEAVTKEEAHIHLSADLLTALHDCQMLYGEQFPTLSLVQQEILIHMSFQLGMTNLRKFKKMNQAVAEENIENWAAEMEDSLWWKQTPRPAKALKAALLKDKWSDAWRM